MNNRFKKIFKTRTSIVILELYTHSEVLLACLRLNQFAGIDMDVITTEAVANELNGIAEWDEIDEQKRLLKNDNQSIKNFLGQFEEKIIAYDLLIITTLSSDFKSWNSVLSKAKKSILIIHNFNTFFYERKKTLPILLNFNSFLNVLRSVRAIFRNENWEKKELLKNANWLLSLEGLDLNRLKEKNITYANKLRFELPICFSLPEIDSKKSNNDFVTITIPGSITDNGKEFVLIFNFFKKCISRFRVKVRLVLLGIPKGKSGKLIQYNFKTLKNNMLDVVCFEKPILRKDFEDYLKQSDFMILPIGKSYNFGRHIEEYGITSISGTVNDAILYKIPAIIPNHYFLKDDLKLSLFQDFNNEIEFENLLIDWVNNRTFSQNIVRFNQIQNNYNIVNKAVQWLNLINYCIKNNTYKKT